MNVLAEASGLVKTAEAALKGLMQRAVSAGEYRDLPTLAKMAEQLCGMTARIGAPEDPARISTPKPPSLSTSRKTKPKGKKEYPRFKREGDRLVKIGWSKSDKAEYLHRAPSSVGRTLLLAVHNVVKSKEVFSVEDLLPLSDASEKSEIPPHQVYVALAWLKAEGIVLPKGREGYTLLVTEEPSKLFDDRWKALPTR